MEWYGENGLEIYCDNGLVAETDDCPCGCPSFTGRTITYVDKNVVGGTGDGSTWANAYTSIQDAIDNHPRKEIDIKGYGELDQYPTGILLTNCNYLKGIGNCWIGGSGYDWVIGRTTSAVITDTVKLENLTIKNTNISPSVHSSRGIVGIRGIFLDIRAPESIGEPYDGCSGTFERCYASDSWYGINFSYYLPSIVTDCHTTNVGGTGISFGMNEEASLSSSITNCTVTGGGSNGGFGFGSYGTMTDCVATGCSRGFYVRGNANLVNCTAINGGVGFRSNAMDTDTIFTGCNAINNLGDGFSNIGGVCNSCVSTGNGTVDTTFWGFGFSKCSNLINCSAVGNQSCGYYANISTIGCSESGNCISTYSCICTDTCYHHLYQCQEV